MVESFRVFIQSRLDAVSKGLETKPKYSELAKANSTNFAKLWRELPQELKEWLFSLDETVNEQREHMAKAAYVQGFKDGYKLNRLLADDESYTA